MKRRDVEFRGKIVSSYNNQLDGKWAYGDLLRSGTVVKIVNTKAAYYVDPETVGQYIGLEDKKENTIFEGDIVKHESSGLIAVVQYSDKRAAFVLSKKKDEIGDTLVSMCHGIETIGIVHDNPELLDYKGGKK
jgi:uncharacterized phage protein (TIGR01671 family)